MEVIVTDSKNLVVGSVITARGSVVIGNGQR